MSLFPSLPRLFVFFVFACHIYHSPDQGLLSVGEKSTLRGMLFDKWESLCDMILHTDQEPVEDVADALPTRCAQLGMCVCESRGLQAYLFHSRLVYCLKPFFTPRRARRIRDASGNMVAQELSQAQQHQQTKLKSNRKLLDDGFVVVCLRPSSRAVPTEEVPPQKYMHSSWKALAMAAMNVRVEGGADSPSALWLHVGHINYTTWALGVLRLDEAGADEDRPEYLKLQVPTPQESCHSVRMFEQSKLNFDGPWQFSVSTILSNNDVLERTSMRPDTVLVRQYAEVPSMEFWQGWPAEEARHEQNMKKRPGTSTRKRKKTPPSDTGAAKKKQMSAAGSARDTVEQPLPGGGPEEDLEQEAVDPAAQLDLLHDEEVRSEASSTPWSEYVADALEGEDPGDDGGLGAEASAAAEPEIHADSVDHVDAAEAAHPRAEPRPTTVVGFKSLGDLRYNAKDSHIMAVCRHPDHVDCRITRTVNAASAARQIATNPAQGRPLGFLCAWLNAAGRCSSATEHKQLAVPRHLSLQSRQEARAEFMREEEATAIASMERARNDGEPDEPAHIR